MAWSPDPSFPQAPEFYRRVLDHLPSPLIVVDELGQIVYGNRAMIELSGRELDEAVDTNILSYLHPDDVGWVTEAFLALTTGTTDATDPEHDAAWSAVHFRIVHRDGTPIPLEVTGATALTDPIVNGVIYDVRPAHTHDLLHRTLIGSARGDDVVELLGNVAATITAPPVELVAAVLEPLEGGGEPNVSHRVLAATDSGFARALDLAGTEPAPWDAPVDEPVRVDLSDVPDAVAERLAEIGVRDLWHVAAHSATGSVSYRIVAGAPIRHVPDIGVRDRIKEAQELAAVVLLRAETDALLAHAATHDQLTGLLNRAGFTAAATEMVTASTAGAVLFLDLDGFKPINDQHGHRAGDEVLRILGDRLRRTARASDLIGRVGGDEFAVILKATDDRQLLPADAYATAERLLLAVSSPITLDGDLFDRPRPPGDEPGRRAGDDGAVRVNVTGSVGVTMIDGDLDFGDLLRRADDAMYRAKRAGGDRPELA